LSDFERRRNKQDKITVVDASEWNIRHCYKFSSMFDKMCRDGDISK